jgi:5,6-dimethylbenzimidazole synthase
MARFYDVVHRRRDVRGEFTGAPVSSVGLSQPWDFVLVRDMATHTTFRDHVQREREVFADQLDEERAGTFSRIKVEGVLESSLGIVVTYDPQRGAPAVLGRPARY